LKPWEKPRRLPLHVAIIMDGNGRWAKKRGLGRALGHRKGVETLRAVVRESSELGIGVLSLYAFSTENWSRSAEEVGALMGLLLEFFAKEIDALHANRVRVRILGDVEGLPGPQRDAALAAMARTAENAGLQLNIALNYGGRDELVRAMRRLMRAGLAPEQVNEKALADALDTAGQPDVDLMIRPGGEMRLSNFLLFQSAYAEFLFPGTLWPDFDVDAYHHALDAYAARERRLGGRKEHGGE